jgi:formylglycine-generating enzyme required for sulfatase activity
MPESNNPKRIPKYLTKPVEQLTWEECQKYIHYLLKEEIKRDAIFQKAMRLLEQIAP